MSTQSLPWFRMYTDFLMDPKMIALAFEDQRHFIGILALKSDGALEQECAPEMMDRIVAQRLWIDHAIIRDVKKRLIAAELIDSDWQPLAWNKRQMRSDADPTNAERQRRHRERQKEAKEAEEKAQSDAENAGKEEGDISNALRNGSVTLTDKSREEEITTLSSKPDPVAQICKGIIDYLNEKTGAKFKHTPANLRLIAVRIKDGATEDEIKKVIDRKCEEWLLDDKTKQWLRPSTLFRPTNYDSYVGQLGVPLPSQTESKTAFRGAVV